MESNLQLAILSAIKAGEEILKVYYGDEMEVELKSDNSPLTRADRMSHVAIAEGLKKTGLPVLSEEGRSIPFSERAAWKLFWLVDPLDGTKEFIKRNGEFTVNIALIAVDMPVLGVVYLPVTRELYFADQSNGSFKALVGENFDERNIEELIAGASLLSGDKYPEIFTIVASRSHLSKETEDFVNTKKLELGDIRLVNSGSSIKFCLVAERKANVYPRLAPTMEWDTAAAHAIARYSNCQVYDYVTGGELRYNKEDLLNPWFVVSAQ